MATDDARHVEEAPEAVEDILAALRGHQGEVSAKIAHALEEVGRDATPQTYAAAIRSVLEGNRVELERILAGAGMAAVLAGMRSILEFRGEAQAASLAVASASEASARPAQRQAKVEVPAEVAGQKLAPAVTEAAAALTTKGAIHRDWLGNLIAEQKVRGKKVAQAAIEEATRVVRDQLAETVQTGTRKGFARKVREALADSSFLSGNTLECAFRTGAMLSYGQGQLQLIQGNDFARDFFPYAVYDATHDDRTREQHLSMEKRGLDGTNVYRIDDPVFLKFIPPWGYNCRCTFSPATVEMAASAGVKEAVEWLRTGNPPASPARVPHPPFEPDAGFVREMASDDWRASYVLGDLATRAPRGGVSIGGTTYKGGQFIPGAVVAQATEAERQALEQAREQPQQKKSTDAKKPAATPSNPKGRGRKKGRKVEAAPQRSLTEDWMGVLAQKRRAATDKPPTQAEIDALRKQAEEEASHIDKALPASGWASQKVLRVGPYSPSKDWRGANLLRDRLEAMRKAGLVQVAVDAAGQTFVSRAGEAVPAWLTTDPDGPRPTAYRPNDELPDPFVAPKPKRAGRYSKPELVEIWLTVRDHPDTVRIRRDGEALDKILGGRRGGVWSTTAAGSAYSIEDGLYHEIAGHIGVIGGDDTTEYVQKALDRARVRLANVRRLLAVFSDPAVSQSADSVVDAVRAETQSGQPNYIIREFAKNILSHKFNIPAANDRYDHRARDYGYPTFDDILDGKATPAEAIEKDRQRKAESDARHGEFAKKYEQHREDMAELLESIPASAGWAPIAGRLRKLYPEAKVRSGPTSGGGYRYEIVIPGVGSYSEHGKGSAEALAKFRASLGRVHYHGVKDDRFKLPDWLAKEPVAVRLAAWKGSKIRTGGHIGEATVVRLNPPSKQYPHGSVRLRNAAGETDLYDFTVLYDSLKSGKAAFIEDPESQTEMAWQEATKYRGRLKKWVGIGDDAGKRPRYQINQPGSGSSEPGGQSDVATPARPKPKPAQKSRSGAGKGRKKVGVRTVPTASLAVDPQRFQYKVNLFGPGGTGEEMSDVQRFRPEFGGLVLVWNDPADGRDYVVNGHHRYALAKRTGHPKIAIHYIEAATAEEARAVGALANIAEGHGTAIDAAKFMRDTGATLDDFRREGVSLKARLAQEAVVLAGLSDALFAKVAMEELSVPRALAIGRHLKSPKDQNSLFDRVRQAEARTKKRIPAEAVEEMAKEMAITSRAGGQVDLFGQTQDRDLFAERGALKAFVRGALSQEANAFKAVSTDRKAETLGRTGNVIKASENRKVADEAGRQRGEFDALANYRGPISDAINRAAERMADDPFHSDQIRRELLDEIRGLLAKGA